MTTASAATLRREVDTFYRQHNPEKLPLLDEVVNEAIALGLDLDYVLEALHEKYRVPRRLTTVHRQPPTALHSDQDGRSQGAAFGQGTLKHTEATAKAKTDDVLKEQIRSWILETLECASDRIELQTLVSSVNPIDALRDGVVLSWLMAKLKDPRKQTMPAAKRGSKYVILDTVTVFLQDAQRLGALDQGTVFSPVDLVESKNDRAVVTALLALGRWALDNGHVAPRVATFDREIEQQQMAITERDIEAAIGAAEDDAASATEVVSDDDDSDNGDAIAAAVLDIELATVLTPELPPPPAVLPTPLTSPPRDVAHATTVHRVTVMPNAPPALEPVPAPDLRSAVSDPLSPKRYQPRRNDTVDERVGQAFNKLLSRMRKLGKQLHGRIARTRNQGEYIIYHLITGKRTVVYVRELSNALMIRVGGGWEDFEAYLARRLVDYEVVAPGTSERRDVQQRRRANTFR
jgi:hypothetical protein